MAAKRKRKTRRTLKPMNSDAAGIDIGSRFHVVAVPPDRDDNPVRSFDSFTGDLHRLADWMESCDIRTRRCKNTVQTISAALEGSYSDDQVLALEQSLSLFDTYQLKIAQCDEHIEAVLTRLRHADSETQPLKRLRRNRKQSNEPKFDVRAAVHAVCGVDLTEVHGVGPYLALRILGECGTDLSKRPTAKHFTSWLGLAPCTKISGGKILSSKTRRTDNRVASLLRLAAMTLGKTDSALGAFYRRLSSRVGKAKAITATARKIAVLVYNLLRYGRAYLDPGARYYEEQHRASVVRNLKRRAKSLGFTIEPAVIKGVS